MKNILGITEDIPGQNLLQHACQTFSYLTTIKGKCCLVFCSGRVLHDFLTQFPTTNTCSIH